MSLKDKVIDGANTEGWHKCFKIEDVAEAVKELKSKSWMHEDDFLVIDYKWINEIFGEFEK